MITRGKGGWTWSDLYNMPVFLRMYYTNKMVKSLQKEAGQSQHRGPPDTVKQKIARPDIHRDI